MARSAALHLARESKTLGKQRQRVAQVAWTSQVSHQDPDERAQGPAGSAKEKKRCSGQDLRPEQVRRSPHLQPAILLLIGVGNDLPEIPSGVEIDGKAPLGQSAEFSLHERLTHGGKSGQNVGDAAGAQEVFPALAPACRSTRRHQIFSHRRTQTGRPRSRSRCRDGKADS